MTPELQMRWSTARYDELEAAAVERRRVALTRRGTEFVIIALRVTMEPTESLVGLLPMTGEEMTFPLGEIDGFHIVDR
ncbi:MAG: hypothetical protein HKM89_04280 [Gemmatimonadales bacterium]|nr:hypothetical protein [Gemmatimonadales bacterium]